MYVLRYREDCGRTDGPIRGAVLSKDAFQLAGTEVQVNLLDVVQCDDAFHKCFPISKVFARKSGELVDVSCVPQEALGKYATVGTGAYESAQIIDLIARRPTGNPSAYTSVLECDGPVRVSSSGAQQSFRYLDTDLGAFVKLSDQTDMKQLMIECLPAMLPDGVSKETLKHYRYTSLVDDGAVLDKHHVLGVTLQEEPANTRWSTRPYPRSHSEFIANMKEWKDKIRGGIPHIQRWVLWPLLVCEFNYEDSISAFNAAQTHTFGRVVDDVFFPEHPPHFGAFYHSSLVESLPLLPDGWRWHNIILSCTGNLNPEVSVCCPMIPAIVSTMLLVVAPHEVYSLLSALIRNSRQPDPQLKATVFLPLTTEAVASFVRRTVEVTNRRTSHSLKEDILLEMIRQTCFSMFVRSFSPVFVLRILDVFFSEGVKVLVRIFVGILNVFHTHISLVADPLKFVAGGKGVHDSLYNICTVDKFREVMQVAFSLRLSRSELTLAGVHNDFGINTAECAQIWPVIDSTPVTIGSDLRAREKLFLWLPDLFRSIKLCFRASQSGYSLAKLYDSCKFRTEGHCLIIIKMDDGSCYGAFSSHVPSQPQRTYKGNSRDFLFAMRTDPHTNEYVSFSQYRATGMNTNFTLPETSHLTFGSGPAMRIAADLHTARSSKCETFGCPALWEDEGAVLDVEVYGVS